MNYLISGNAPIPYPVETFFGVIYFAEEQIIEIPFQYPLIGEWGIPASAVFEEPKERLVPQKLDVVYLSVIEGVFYSVETEVPQDIFLEKWNRINISTGNDHIPYVVVGFAPYGLVAFWIYSCHKSILVSTFQAVRTIVDMSDFRSANTRIQIEDVCQRYINNDLRVKENLEQNGLPPRDLFDKYMQQFTYRYLPLFEQWNENDSEWRENDKKEGKSLPEFDYIEESLFDGTHDKLHDGELMNYHQAGKTKKLAVKWHIKKSEYTAYFWFEDEEIRAIFDRFYGAHPETKTDFMIRIDAEKNKYELALYRYGLKEPQVISESAYQLLVFKNKFEYYRSENYNQPRGAWIW
jgi:hypothetical protein